jgi:protoheme IX farnesyltransferase
LVELDLTEPETNTVTDLPLIFARAALLMRRRPAILRTPPSWRSWRDYVSLMKPRVMTLVVFTGLAGLWLRRER